MNSSSLTKITLALLASSIFTAVSGNGAAVLPYETNFETTPGAYTVNTSIVGQQGWVNFSGSALDSTIINDPTGSGQGQLLSMINGAGTQQYFANVLPGDEAIVISYQTYGATASHFRDFASWLFVNDNASNQIASISINGGGKFVLNDTNQVPDITPGLETWYTIALTVKRVDGTLDLSITDGVTTGVLNDIPFQFASPTNQLGKIGFLSGVYNSDAVVYVDNVSVAPVPEPATVALLGLGGIGLVWASRRRSSASKIS